jgi:hypothetical protein
MAMGVRNETYADTRQPYDSNIMLLREWYPVCSSCGKRVDLTTSVRDENGMAFHQKCRVKIVPAKPQEKGIFFPNKFPERQHP